MRLVLQRVKQASVTVQENVVGAIGRGWLVLLAVGHDDDLKDVEAAVEKTVHLRMFSDEDGKFNLSTVDLGAELLVVSQFTLYGDCRKGRRPSFSSAAKPDHAKQLYEAYVEQLKSRYGINVQTGVFQQHMDVALVNDGPVTMLIDTKRLF